MSEDPDRSVSFPAFHERASEMGPGDLARVRLAEATRAFIRASLTSVADADDVLAVAALLDEALVRVSRAGADGVVAAADSHFTDRSPFYGAMNPLSMPMRLGRELGTGEFDVITGRAVFTEPHEGPPGHVHGGFIAAAFDEVLGMSQSLTGRPGMTGRLSVTYRAPTPLHSEIVFRGRVDRVEGRKIHTVGTAHHGDVLCAEAEGLFLSFPPEMIDRLRKGRDISDPRSPRE